MPNRLGFVVALVCSVAPGLALAQGRPVAIADRKAGRDYALELELDWSGTGDDDVSVNTLLPKLNGSFGLTRHAELEVQLPTAFVDFNPDGAGEGDSGLIMGNPFVALYYASRTDRMVARIGLGIGLPVVDQAGALDDPDDYAEGIAPFYAYITRGLQDPWLYYPNTLSLVVPGQVQMRNSMLAIGLDGALAILISTDSDVRDETELTVQLGGFVGAALDDITLGLRLQVVTMPTEEGDDTQLGMMPFVQADLDGGGFLYAGYLVSLDDPVGVLGDNDLDVLTLRIGGGARF